MICYCNGIGKGCSSFVFRHKSDIVIKIILNKLLIIFKQTSDINYLGSFPFVPPQYVMLPPVTEHVSLHSKSLCKNIARASGGCK